MTAAEPPIEEPAQATRLTFMCCDQVRRALTIFRSNGSCLVAPLPPEMWISDSVIATTSWEVDRRVLRFVTTGSEVIEAELPSLEDMSPTRSRPAVYLDQNHWSTLTLARLEPERVLNPDELSAALRIIEMAEGDQVLLPLSGGHMAETCKWTSFDDRYDLALTMLQLSRGWQMRDPLEVRRNELRASLAMPFLSDPVEQPDVITLEPDAIHGTRIGWRPTESGTDLPPDYALMANVLTCTSVNLDVMLHADDVQPAGGLTGWVIDQQRFTDWLGTEPKNLKYLKRARTTARFLADLGRELPEEAYRCGLTAEQMSDWTLNRSDEAIAAMPMLGLFRDVMHEKLSDPGTRWKPNDLYDIMYLTCAAGYADYVAGDKALIGNLRPGVARLGREVKVAGRLSELASML